MSEQIPERKSSLSLADELAATLRQVDRMIARHEAGKDYTVGQERLTWFHLLVKQFYEELVEFSILSQKVSYNGGSGEDIRRRTCAELCTSEPATFRSPAQALTAGHLDLLNLVEYTVSARALLRERRAWIMEQAMEKKQK
jgi:hypothetical protein